MHVAGVHLAPADHAGGNAAIVQARAWCRVTTCSTSPGGRKGSRIAPALSLRSVTAAVSSRPAPGSAARGAPGRGSASMNSWETAGPRAALASDHRGVAEAVRSGWADAGVCLRLVSEEAGLDFLPVREEFYDLCFPDRFKGDHRIQALLQVVRSPSYRKALGELPGYKSTETGTLGRVT